MESCAKNESDQNNYARNETSVGRASCVRFSHAEFERILQAKTDTGQSIPQLLKESFFGKPPALRLMDRDQAAEFLIAMGRIGTNVNQIARKINSGYREGWYSQLEHAIADIAEIRAMICKRGWD